MREFFGKKTRDTDLPMVREMYGHLAEFCAREGKRVRPLLLIASCVGYGGGRNRDDIVRVASVLEMLHSFLLIQDDVIDRSDLRRGGKTLHMICKDLYGKDSHNPGIGNDIALILGDVLMANLHEIVGAAAIPPRSKDRFMSLIGRMLEITAWGQILDVLNSNSKRIRSPRETAEQIAMMKTAHYTVYYPMLMGHALAGRDSVKEVERIRGFSFPLGMAFQIRDDILGVFGSEKNTGKPSDSDILEGKMTLLVNGAIENLDGKDRRKFLSLFTKKRKDRGDVKAIRTMIIRSGSLETVKEMHSGLVEQSRQRLSDLSITEEYRAVLAGLVDIMARM